MEEDDSLCCTTELRLSLPGSNHMEARPVAYGKGCKRALVDDPEDRVSRTDSQSLHHNLRHLQSDSSFCKSSIVGWPPIRSQRKNNAPGSKEADVYGIYVKVSMDGAPFLRKIDLKLYEGYAQLLLGLENMFRISIGDYSEREGYRGSDYAPTYEDKDGDWMLVGDVPWDMFKSSCRRLRIMKGVEATGLGCGI